MNLKNYLKLSIIKKLITVLILVIVVFTLFKVFGNKKSFDPKFLTEQLIKSSELTSAKVKMTAIHKFEDKGLFIINKQNFIMVYDATVRAGLNMDDINVKVNKVSKRVVVEIPSAEIQGVEIDHDSIKYYDESFALFNINQKDDSNKAISEALEEAKEKAKDIGIIELADSHAETLIVGILSPLVKEDYKIEVVKK